LHMFELIGNRCGALYALLLLGFSALYSTDLVAADTHCRQALQLAQQLTSRYAIALAFAGLAGLAACNSDLQQAAQLARAAAMLHAEIGSQPNPVAGRIAERAQAAALATLSADQYAAACRAGETLAAHALVAL